MLIIIVSAILAALFGGLWWFSDGHWIAKFGKFEYVPTEDSLQARNHASILSLGAGFFLGICVMSILT